MPRSSSFSSASPSRSRGRREASDSDAKRPQTHQPVQQPDEEAMPRDIEAFRLGLLRRMVDVQKGWRHCREPICKRMKRCAGPDRGAGIRCVRDNPRPPLTPQQRARAAAQMHRMLQRRASELGPL
jgi:hypothetical protein